MLQTFTWTPTVKGGAGSGIPPLAVPEEKHLAGQHDQQLHGKKKNTYILNDTNVTGRITRQKPTRDLDRLFGYPIIAKVGKLPNDKSPWADIRHIQKICTDIDSVTVLDKRRRMLIRRPQFAFGYIWSDTRKNVGGDDLEYAKSIELPKNVDNIRINPDRNPPDGLQATWTDRKSKKQYGYTAEHIRYSQAKKYSRVLGFETALQKINNSVQRDLRSRDLNTRENAQLTYILSKTGLHLGNEATRPDIKTFGLSTLKVEHASVKENENGSQSAVFNYVGAAGNVIFKSVLDKTMAAIIRHQSAGKQPGEKLFSHTSAPDVAAYVKSISGGFTPKDFRVYRATYLAMGEVLKRRGAVATTEKEFRKWQRDASKIVSKQMGTSIRNAIQNLVSPQVWNAWRRPDWDPWTPKSFQVTGD